MTRYAHERSGTDFASTVATPHLHVLASLTETLCGEAVFTSRFVISDTPERSFSQPILANPCPSCAEQSPDLLALAKMHSERPFAFEWQKYAYHAMLPEGLVDERIQNVETFDRGIVGQMIDGWMASGCPERVTVWVEVPSSWWQHFKRDVLRMSSYKTTQVSRTVTVYRRVCPHKTVTQAWRHAEWVGG